MIDSPPGRLLTRWGYALGGGVTMIGLTPISLLLLFYLTNMVGLRGSLAGLVLALPKIWDALVDPMVGGWTDRTATRLGRRWPFLLFSGLVFLAAVVFMFSLPALPLPWMIAALATLFLAIASTAQTVFGVCQLSMASDMTRDPADLTKLFSLAMILAAAIAIASSVMTPMLVTWSGGGRTGYSRMAMEIAGAALVFLLAFVALTRRAPVLPAAAGTVRLSLLASIRATVGNHSFYFLIAFIVVFGIGRAILTAFLPYANLYVLHGSSTSFGVLVGVDAAAAIAGYLLAPIAVRRFGPKRALMFSNLAMSLCYGLMFAASFGPYWASWVAVSAIGVTSGALGILLQTGLLEVAKIPLKNGHLVPMGFYFGIYLAASKLGLSAGGFCAGLLLDLVGFVPGGAHQAASTVEWLRAGYTLIPLAFFVAAGLLFLGRITEAQSGPPVAAADAAAA